MTTFTTTARFGRTARLRGLMLASALALGLAGCESGTSLLSNASSDAAPQAAVATPPPQSPISQTARLEIAPIIGAPENVARDLQAQLGNAIEKNKITVAHGATARGEYVLRGYVVAAREKAGTKISYIWDVTDQTGKRAHRITGEESAAASGASDPWSAANAQIIQSIAEKTATQIAAWHNAISGVPVASATAATSTQVAAAAAPTATAAAVAQPAAAVAATPAAVSPSAVPAAQTAALTSPAATGPTTGSIEQGQYQALVPGVSGAPGDGGLSLTSAIQRELSKSGVALTTTPGGTATYKVEGKVAMGQGKDGKQPIQIDWTVVDPAGKKLGTVSQKNEIPQGSLDGAWGKTADAAAQAAAQGIVKLLPAPAKTN